MGILSKESSVTFVIIQNGSGGIEPWINKARAVIKIPLLMEGALVCLALSFVIQNVSASTGDRSQMFHSCLENCLAENCSAIAQEFHIPLHLRLLQWTCSDECKYFCMWPTVDWFIEAGIGAQQFYGKWPFLRIFGVQEPAAAIFSILNLACHVAMIRRFNKEVNSKAPFYWLTNIFCFVCCHAWFWSTLFHVRDVRFTEIMDYLGAFSMVLFSVYHFSLRATALSSFSSLSSIIFGSAIGLFFVYHSYTTFFVKMDYGYNMLINIAFGAVNILGWSVWCFKHYKKRPYVKRCAAFTSLVAVTTLLEILDFPPFFWVLDAHALWHMTTSPLVVLWYRFLIDDCHFLESQVMDYEKIA
uniref:Post-GPI attachment to proteins factor 3 n=1 Tax=Megafenestra aurita TaxID=2291010 RepID=A0A4Y7NIK0_9CRUS|nr:EOG090X0702 [Megafenestra aurita]